MEYLNGGSLSWHLDELKMFKEKQVKFYTAQILCGIQYLHSKQIVHRDIKLQNVLLDSIGNAKICDFGSCGKMKSTLSTFKRGTPLYRAPESIISGALNYSSDYWSLGVCTFKMLTGFFPFENEQENFPMPDPRTKKVLNKYEISLNAINFVSKLLIRDADERLLSCQNIKNNAFFNDLDWYKLENGQIKPPFKLNVNI